jgi:hypothetical protein
LKYDEETKCEEQSIERRLPEVGRRVNEEIKLQCNKRNRSLLFSFEIFTARKINYNILHLKLLRE